MENTQNTQAQKPQWYVLQTLSGYEKMVQNNLRTMVENNNLQDYIVDVVVPEEEEITEKNERLLCVENTLVMYLSKWFIQNMFGIW